ncbi:hypothetical protein Agabi119p4_3215 [Agaricus bisporus var. burnettii]|uniref:Peptidase S9 prolyl oligopeptidase catalytic domain-containing protein n=1 Tax=Agaricus bisporus var. burnettii TaxID=192524 RepID=A0A8H7F6T0_AGABI|nr:hypothetical protein Agabi119p4_3215 [Agaricus bisporus var. burnettii]
MQGQQQWNLTLLKDWDVLGPFPLHAREQHFLSPSFPIDLREPIDYERTWPSSYADYACVCWSKTRLSDEGVLEVSFPQIRWGSLRRTEGWAALQHHALLRGTLVVTPPAEAAPGSSPPRILVQLKQGSYFCILPIKPSGMVPEWYAGNIYDLERALPRMVDLPLPPDPTATSRYDIFISGEYEIRFFGDPLSNNTEVPTQVISLSVELECLPESIQHEPSQDVLCDFVDGYAFGEALGVGLRNSRRDWLSITRVESRTPGVSLKLKQAVQLAPTQVRVVSFTISQDRPLHADKLEIVVTESSESGQESSIRVSLAITHKSAIRSCDHQSIKATYFSGDSTPTNFLAVPPTGQGKIAYPPILALHGAGVDIINQTFWAESIPPSDVSWTILPSGRTSWGLDWHGPSAQDAWDSVDALPGILDKISVWKDTSYKVGTPVILLGHSNGGQGAWWLASRSPDRILALVPAAGYIKSQAYVPLTMSRSAHFIDPSLRAVLESSLTPDDNDLFLTNLTHKPVLVIHGGEDDNVPIWHGRELFSVLKTWSLFDGSGSNPTMKEDPERGHWYPTVFNNRQVIKFIQGVLKPNEHPQSSKVLKPFTLTAFRPEESGSLEGWRIEEVTRLGRLARITVVPRNQDGIYEVQTINVKKFSVSQIQSPYTFLIDGNKVEVDAMNHGPNLTFERDHSSHKWKLTTIETSSPPSPPTRLQTFLSTKGPITFIPLTAGTSRQHDNRLSLAVRLAHDLQVYHRLDACICPDYEVVGPQSVGHWPKCNIVLIGSQKDPVIQSILEENKLPISMRDGQLTLNGRLINIHPDTGIMLLHPHPTTPDALMMLMIGNNIAALERIGRLFPIRTGITTPSWIMVGPLTDALGAAGVTGAGVWGHGWTWNEGFSWSEYL